MRGKTHRSHRQRGCSPTLLRQPANPVHLTPQRRFHGQEQISSRQVNRFVGRLRAGILRSRKTPVSGIQVSQRKLKHNDLGQRWLRDGSQEASQRRQFRRLPIEAEIDVKRLDAFSLIEQVGDKNGAIQSAAGQYADGGCRRCWHGLVSNRPEPPIPLAALRAERSIALATVFGGHYTPAATNSRGRAIPRFFRAFISYF